ncbi:MAG: prolyl oligopeptidase family serine peptidase [Planctomycetes bacterium]|nr:prolyl oligopeptidase family serine peptidase [Planctomycetota bacterium]
MLRAEAPVGEAGARPLTEVIRPFFAPPERFRGQFGSFRDPMLFDDGTPVKPPADWPRRRAEILATWHAAMGPWREVNPTPKVTVIATERVDEITRHKASVELAPGRFQDCYLLVPAGSGPFPAVLVIWYTAGESAGIPSKPGDPVPIYAFGLDLAKRGFVTLCMADTKGISNDPGVQPLSFAAYGAANACNALANRPEVDPARIGVTGFSMGGKTAMFASCLYEKFACAAWIDGGIVWNEQDSNANYWEAWYLGTDAGATRKVGPVTAENPRRGAYKTLIEGGHDLHELHALMAPRPFLVSGGAQDPIDHWVPLNHAIRLYGFLGYQDRVAMTNRPGHYPTEESNQQLYAFFEHFLVPKR